MAMILQLLVAAVAVGLSVAVAPPYKQQLQAIEESTKNLERNVLSMEGNIPLLNDSRRGYAVIVNVVYYLGEERSGCFFEDYYKEYYPFLDISVPEAMNNPELVVTKIKNLSDNVHNSIGELNELINSCVLTTEVCNELIHDTVKENPDQFRHSAIVLIAASDLAKDLNELNEKFEEVSKNTKADQYVITSPKDLKHVVDRVAHLYRILNAHSRQCEKQ